MKLLGSQPTTAVAKSNERRIFITFDSFFGRDGLMVWIGLIFLSIEAQFKIWNGYQKKKREEGSKCQ
jgi:hypothetical protein